MAYVDQDSDDVQQPAQTGTEGPQTASGDVSGGFQQAEGQGVAAQPSQTKAPQYQNLGAYLTANAPQTQQMGQNVASGLSQQNQQIQSDISNATNAFNQAVQAGSVVNDPALLQSAFSNPAQFVKNPSDVAKFQGQLNAQYTGPTDFNQSDAYTGLNAQVQNAVQAAQNIATPSGLQTLIGTQERNPTRGIQNLDALLLQQNPEAQAAIRGAAQPLASLGDYFGTQTQAATDAAKQAADITAQTRAATQAASQQASNQFQQGLQSQLQGQEAQRQQYNQQLQTIQQKMAANQPLSAAEAQLIGLTVPQYNALLSARSAINPLVPVAPIGNYYPGVPLTNAPTLETASTPEQYANDAALEMLLGDQYNNILNPAQANLAGTWTPSTNMPQLKGDTYAQDLLKAYLQQDPRANAQGQTMNQEMLLNFLANTAGTQLPTQYNYRTPAQIDAIKSLLGLYQQGLLRS